MRRGHHEGIEPAYGVWNVERFGISLGQPLNVLKVKPLVVARLMQWQASSPILHQGRSRIARDNGGQNVARTNHIKHRPCLGRKQILRPGNHLELIQLPAGIMLAKTMQGKIPVGVGRSGLIWIEL